MSEQYRKNVQAMCDRLGISNDPSIDEVDLKVSAVSFEADGAWVRIEGTDTNKAGRLFFQENFSRRYLGDGRTFIVGRLILGRAEWHFDQRWLDAEKNGSPMLSAFKLATRFIIHWK